MQPAKRHPVTRLTIRTNVHAGIDWQEVWTDVRETGSTIGSGLVKAGSTIGSGLSQAASSAKSAIHQATA